MKKLLLMLSILFVGHISFAQTDSTSALKLYPETANEYVNIYVTFDTPTDFSMTMVSKVWREALEWKEYAKETFQKKVDVHNLPEGIYNVFIEYNGKTERKSFTIKHE